MAIKNTRNRNLSNINHVYNRARDGRVMFADDRDRDRFQDMLVRAIKRSSGKVDVISACPLTTHYHLINRERRAGALASFMNGLISPYVRYFNKRHGTSGALFDGEYRTVPILNERQLRWKIGYVHDNHRLGVGYKFSTHRYYLLGENDSPSWLDVKTGLGIFGGIDEYLEFLARREIRKGLNEEFFDE